jgi:hypothetical protein
MTKAELLEEWRKAEKVGRKDPEGPISRQTTPFSNTSTTRKSPQHFRTSTLGKKGRQFKKHLVCRELSAQPRRNPG